MSHLYVTHTLYLDNHPIVRKHCDHDRDVASWRVELRDNMAAVYLHGTPEQLLAFAGAIQREVAPASSVRPDAGRADRLLGTQAETPQDMSR